MAKKRKPSGPPEIIAGRKQRAYSGERLERLRKSTWSKLHSELEHLRAEVDSARNEFHTAVLFKTGTAGWIPAQDRFDLDISILKAELILLDREKAYLTAYLTASNGLRAILKFNPKRRQRAKQSLPVTIEEINANIEAIRGELELKRRYKAEWESFFSTLRLNVSRDKTLSNEFEKINKMVDETKLRAKNAFAKKRRRLGLLRQSWKLGAYNSRPEYQRQIDNAILEYAKAGIDLAKAQEDLWIFWHRVAVKSPASNPPPHMLEELARRRHNSTGHKNSLQMLITKLSTK